MFRARQLPTADLIRLCHLVRLNHEAGVPLAKVFRQLGERSTPRLKPVAAQVAVHLEHGESLKAALEAEAASFPALFVSLAVVGEETGHLPEVLHELEKYYVFQQKSWRMVRAAALMPAIQLVFGVALVAIVIYILGMIAASRGTEPPAVLGFRGTGGALLFLAVAAGVFVVAALLYLFITRTLARKRLFDGLLLRIPAIGGCLEAYAVARFATALRLTLDSTLPLGRALRLSLQATGNGAFVGSAETIVGCVKAGDELTVALGRGQVFPPDFLSMIAVGEEGGRLDAVLEHQAAHYQDLAGRRARRLLVIMSRTIWLGYVLFAAFAIFSLSGSYLRPLGG
jgi:type IV pilus assembly protein PilC